MITQPAAGIKGKEMNATYTSMGTIAKIARELGHRESATYGPKFTWITPKGLMVFVDDYGHYTTVHENDKGGRLLASTHPNESFCASGNWQEHILLLESEADAKAAQREKSEHDRKEAQIAARQAPFNV